jgi:predicted nucleic acid-binding protein
MKIIIDLNVLLDVIQKRLPHYDASAKALSRVLNGEVDGVLPGHAVTTIYYIVAKYADRSRADGAVDWMISHFDVEAAGRVDFVQGR